MMTPWGTPFDGEAQVFYRHLSPEMRAIYDTHAAMWMTKQVGPFRYISLFGWTP